MYDIQSYIYKNKTKKYTLRIKSWLTCSVHVMYMNHSKEIIPKNHLETQKSYYR